MSQILINQYLNDLDRYRKYSGSLTEGVISEAFKDLLKNWARQANLHFINQYEFVSTQKNRIRPDGTILHDLRVPLGYWEAKDTKDDLDEEIRKKLAKGYPQDNIIFENSETAVLIQNRQEVMRCAMIHTGELYRLLVLFFRYERQEIRDFRKAVEQFKADLPAVLTALRGKIEDAYRSNVPFSQAATKFLDHARETINPSVTEADIREMLIQHILTEEIFAHVFDQGDFHRENNIAKELYTLENTFFVGALKRETLKGLEPYYATIRANAALITSHAEKQTFLKVIYENFYKVYDTKKADRLGVVYTPNEIVKFMIEGADWLCEKHFGKNLIDEHVEILDPATGTGTFICELLEHFRGDRKKLAHKYKNELHANEVAILPYYVANLNIEATYAAITGQFAEYPNLCFVDTLDNVAGLGIRSGYQHDMFAGLSDENVARVKRQNARKISVIIGNPPYNANQANENDNNKNREYPHIDDAVRAKYVKKSRATWTKMYDMYIRFFRWASDRISDDGIVSFVTNGNFLDSASFDGFRKAIFEEYSEIYVVNLGGDVRANAKLSGTKNNVFGIQTGVAITFLLRKRGKQQCLLYYADRPEFDTAEDKLGFLASHKLGTVQFKRLYPDERGNWLSQADTDWDSLLELVVKDSRTGPRRRKGVFDLHSLGVNSGRDEWVIGLEADDITDKLKFFSSVYNSVVDALPRIHTPDLIDQLSDTSIKWTRELKRLLVRRIRLSVQHDYIVDMQYRPFSRRKFYYRAEFSKYLFGVPSFFPMGNEDQKVIAFPAAGATPRVPFSVAATSRIPDLNFFSPDPSHTVPRYRYSPSGEKIDNITDWGLKQFRDHYGKDAGITKDDIFAYVYGVLHDPAYREKYAINLKREFPRIPFYADFAQWAEWGRRLMDLHIGYESVEPWPIARADMADEKVRATGVSPKPILKSDPDNGVIRIDGETTLSGIPREVWTYRLGNRSGVDWVLDQYKEKTPKDPTIREKFNTYRFADYKEHVIDLIARVSLVSVETMAIVDAMKTANR